MRTLKRKRKVAEHWRNSIPQLVQQILPAALQGHLGAGREKLSFGCLMVINSDPLGSTFFPYVWTKFAPRLSSPTYKTSFTHVITQM